MCRDIADRFKDEFLAGEACISSLGIEVLIHATQAAEQRNTTLMRTARKDRGWGGVLEVRIEFQVKGHVGSWKSWGKNSTRYSQNLLSALLYRELP